MKKFLMTLVLATASVSFAVANVQDAAQPTQQKTIKDPNEYNAYISATSQTDPAQKAAALEAFVQQYPSSIVKEEALIGAMSAYQQAGNPAKLAEAAGKVLQAYPNNILALAVAVSGRRQQFNSGTLQQAQAMQVIGEAAQLAQRGLPALGTWTKPEGVSDADFQKQKTSIGAIFNGTIGQNAIARQDWPTAQKFMKEAAMANPTDYVDSYFTGYAFLNPKPNTDENLLTGLWFIARAAALAPQVPDFAKFGKFYFKKYHGNEESWDQFVQQAKADTSFPGNPAIASRVTKAPSPAEQVGAMLRQNPNIETLSFGEWVLIFTYGSPADKAAAFERIKGKPFKFQGSVINATPETVDVALTQDAIDAKKAEVSVTLTEPMKKVPAPGAPFSFQGNPVSFTTDPFLITMDNGVDLTPAAKGTPKKAAPKKAPAKRPAAKKR
ncbi:MAG TPA: hypothetical protein VM009_06305 [Terriglobales bacterium]|nr:hypothetical protein [Terriglobales bacterium]